MFSEFELGVLLILIVEKKTNLEIDFLDLKFNQKYIDINEFRDKYNNYTITLKSMEELKNKIEKGMEKNKE